MQCSEPLGSPGAPIFLRSAILGTSKGGEGLGCFYPLAPWEAGKGERNQSGQNPSMGLAELRGALGFSIVLARQGNSGANFFLFLGFSSLGDPTFLGITG